MKKVFVGSYLIIFTTLIYSAEVDIYGKIQMDAWWIRMERFYEGTVDTSINGDTVFSDDSIPVVTGSLFPEGTLGFKFSTDRFIGCIEMGIYSCVYGGELVGNVFEREFLIERKPLPFLKKWYAEWLINDYLGLLFGQDFSPGCFFTSNQAFFGGNSFLNSGCLYTGRHPMLQLSLHDPNRKIEFKIAASPSDTFSLAGNETLETSKYVGERKLPKFEGSFGIELEKNIFSLSFKCAGGYQKYGFVAIHPLPPDKKARRTVEAFVIGATNKVKIGPVSPSVSCFYGQNLGIYGVYVGDPFRWWQISDYIRIFYPVYDPDINKILNGRAFEINGILNIQPWEFLYWEGALGYVTGEHDDKRSDVFWFPQYSWYNQISITLLENLKLTGEIGQYIFGPYFGGGRYLYWGMSTRIDF